MTRRLILSRTYRRWRALPRRRRRRSDQGERCHGDGEGGGQRDRQQHVGPDAGAPVSSGAKFKQTPTKIQVFGFFFELLPHLRRPLLAVRERGGGARVEVVPVPATRERKE
ncbi:hypothetical protein WMY93_034117, partial [Mugilogobius chulae]